MNTVKNILILGGYGAVGYETAKILLNETDCNITLAGRSYSRAVLAANNLYNETNRNRVSGIALDAYNYSELLSAFRLVDLVVVSIPITDLGNQLAKAAYDVGINYIDINGNEEKRKYLENNSSQIERKGLTFVSEAGMVPGLPSLLFYHAREKLGKLTTVEFGSICRETNVSYGSAYDLLIELGIEHRIYSNEKWKIAAISDGKDFDFGNKFGKCRCYPFEFFELYKLPVKELGIKDLGYYAAGFNPVVDMTFLIWKIFGLYRFKLGLKFGAKFLVWAGRFTKPPFITLVQINALGFNEKKFAMSVSHADPYIATAIPLAACITQMIETDLFEKKGLHLMGHLLSPSKFLEDIKRLGMNVNIDPQ